MRMNRDEECTTASLISASFGLLAACVEIEIKDYGRSWSYLASSPDQVSCCPKSLLEVLVVYGDGLSLSVLRRGIGALFLSLSTDETFLSSGAGRPCNESAMVPLPP